MSPTILIAAAAAIASGLAGFALAWQLQAGNISEIKLGAANERIAIQRAARQTLERVTGQIATAQVAARKRDVRVRVDSDRAGNAGNGLRLSSTAAVRTVADDPDACNSIIAAYDTILAEGSGFIREVAASADQCLSDVQTLTDSWPKE